jgi:WD40 repeat protein
MDGDLSPDGRVAVSCGHDKEVRFWQVDTGQCIRTEKLARAIECARFISLTDVAAAVGNDVQLWHVDIPPDPRVYQPMLSIPKSASAAKETQDLLDEKLVEVDGLLEASRPAAAQALIREAQAIPGLQHEEQLLQRLAVCGKQGSRYQFREWWLSNSFHLGEFEGLGGVQSVRFSPDSTVLAAGHQEGIVGIFDIIRGQQRTVLSRQIGFVRSLLFLDQETLLSMSHFGDVIRWDLDTGKGERDSGIEVKRSMHLSTVLSEDGSYQVLIGLGGYSLLPIRMSMVSPVRADPYETELTRADPDLDVPAIMDPKGNAGWLYKSAASPDGSLFTTTLLEGSRGGDIHTIYVFKTTEGGVRIENRLLDHTNPVLVMTFAPTSDQLASGDLAGNVKLWNVAAESCIRTLTMPGSQITALAYSSDGQHLLVGDKDGSLFLWDIYGHLLAQNHAHGKKINALAFSPDGRFAASGGFDNTINLWGFDWDYKFSRPAYWDEGARPYLEIFLTLHTPYGSDDISRVGVPTWTEEDFQQLLVELGYRGYGWLRPEGVRRQLEELAAQRT